MTSTRTRPSRSSTVWHAELPAIRGLRNDIGRGVLNAMRAGMSPRLGRIHPGVNGGWIGRAADRRSDGCLAREGADVVVASRYMKGGHQVGGRSIKRLMSRTAGLTLHWFAGVADPRSDEQLQALHPPVPQLYHDRKQGRVRARPRADRPGDPRRPAGRGGADDLAGPHRRQINFKLRKWLPIYLHWYWVAIEAGGSGRAAPDVSTTRDASPEAVEHRLSP